MSSVAQPPYGQSRLAQALRNARIAFFDHRPAGADAAGAWHWSGARFGIEGIDGPDGRARLVAAVEEQDRPPLLEMLGPRTSERARSGEFRVRTPTGRTLYLYCETYTGSDNGGDPAVVFGTVQDVTNQRRFEAELTEIVRQNHVLLATIDACPISITVADATKPDLPLTYVNRSFTSLTGYESAVAVGRNCRFLQGAATKQAVVDHVRERIAAEAQTEVEIVNYRRDGSQFLNRFTLAPVHDATGQLTAYIGLQSDITQDAGRRDAEAQRQKMEALGRMMGGVAHEINNMLQPVSLLGQDLIDRDLVAAEGRQHLGILVECSGKARQIIGDLLAFSRPTPRRAEVHDPATLLHDSLRLVRQALPPAIVISVATEGQPPPVACDRTKFVQILLNLATNAAAAMDGHGTLRLSLDRAHPDMARLRVADTGCGMDKTTLDRAFEPFFTTKPVGQGTGLGLPMIYGLIREMGGTIRLDSEPGRGTTATILLPASPPPADPMPVSNGASHHGFDPGR
jgi:PAS domain S-box-containing protein